MFYPPFSPLKGSLSFELSSLLIFFIRNLYNYLEIKYSIEWSKILLMENLIHIKDHQLSVYNIGSWNFLKILLYQK